MLSFLKRFLRDPGWWCGVVNGQLILDTFAKVAEEGFDMDRVEAVIHQVRFRGLCARRSTVHGGHCQC